MTYFSIHRNLKTLYTYIRILQLKLLVSVISTAMAMKIIFLIMFKGKFCRTYTTNYTL